MRRAGIAELPLHGGRAPRWLFERMGRLARAMGELKFVLLGEKLLGSWVLVRARGGCQWLLIKHRDEHASQEDLTLSKPRSVVSGRTLAGIGQAAGASPRQLQQAPGADSSPRLRPRPAGRPGP